MSTVNGLNGRMKTAAEKTNQSKDALGVVRLQLSRLRTQGLCVDLEVNGTRMGRAKATLAEFGISDKDERAEFYDGGSKIMFSLEFYKELRSVETSYRGLLNKYAYRDISGLAPWAWITFEAWAEWRAEAELLEARFELIKKKILRDYDEQKAAYLTREAAAASRAWAAIKAQKFDGIVVRGRTFAKESEFVDFIVERSAAKFPSKEKIKAGIKIGYKSAVVADIGELEVERAKKDATLKKLSAQSLEMSEKARAIYDAELEAQRQRLAEAKLPFDELAQSLRERINLAASGMLESVKKNGSIRGKVAEQVNNLMTIYKLMQVTDDRTLTARLTELQTLVGPVGKERLTNTPRDTKAIQAKLEQIIDVTEREVADIEKIDPSVLALEL